jgi:hypothetical protein
MRVDASAEKLKRCKCGSGVWQKKLKHTFRRQDASEKMITGPGARSLPSGMNKTPWGNGYMRSIRPILWASQYQVLVCPMLLIRSTLPIRGDFGSMPEAAFRVGLHVTTR